MDKKQWKKQTQSKICKFGDFGHAIRNVGYEEDSVCCNTQIMVRPMHELKKAKHAWRIRRDPRIVFDIASVVYNCVRVHPTDIAYYLNKK